MEYAQSYSEKAVALDKLLASHNLVDTNKTGKKNVHAGVSYELVVRGYPGINDVYAQAKIGAQWCAIKIRTETDIQKMYGWVTKWSVLGF